MDGAQDAYGRLIIEVERRFPRVASEIREAVARGRLVPAAALTHGDRQTRNERIKTTKTEPTARAERIAKTDIATVSYSGDESLALLLEAIDRLAATMASSRRALTAMSRRFDVSPRVSFSQADGGTQEALLIGESLDQLEVIQKRLHQVVATALGELTVPHDRG